MLPKDVLSKITRNNLQKIIDRIYFCKEIVCIDPMKRISPKGLTILTITCNFWVLIYLKPTHYCALAQNTGVYKIAFKMCWWCDKGVNIYQKSKLG